MKILKRCPRIAALLVAFALAGCATSYDLTLMPRTAGKMYYGQAVEKGGQADVAITIDEKTYTGTWVAIAPERTTGYISGGIGFGTRRGGIGIGTAPVIVDSAVGTEAKALLQAPDGSGLRCDFKGMGPGRTGGGTCQDDKGLLYDVQIRLKEGK